MKASSSSPRPTGPTCSIRRCCARAASTARSSCRAPTSTAARRSSRVHMKKVPLAPDVDPRVIARGTPGFSGADLANLVNEAALLAARTGKRLVAMQEFEDAKDKVHDGHRAHVDGHDRGREADDRLSRGRPRHRRAARAGVRPDPQGDDHPARPRAGHGHAPAGARQLQLSPRQDVREPRRRDGRPRRRGSDLRLRQGLARAPRPTSSMRPGSPATW